MDAAVEMQLNNVKSLKTTNSMLAAQLSQLARELQDKEKLVSCMLRLYVLLAIPNCYLFCGGWLW